MPSELGEKALGRYTSSLGRTVKNKSELISQLPMVVIEAEIDVEISAKKEGVLQGAEQSLTSLSDHWIVFV